MRIAFCLFGVIGGIEGKAGYSTNNPEIILETGYNHYKKFFFDKYNIDVFIHTWNFEYEKEIIKYYNPVKSIFQKQKIFNIPGNAKVNKAYQFIEEKREKRIQNIYSRWYSHKSVVNLKNQYEKENDFIYDFVITTRFDIAFLKSINFNTLRNDKFYLAPWCYNINILGKKIQNANYYNYKEDYSFPLNLTIHRDYKYPYVYGIADFWFLSNSEFMNRFSTLFDNLKEYSSDVEVSSHILAEYHLKKIGIFKDTISIMHRFKHFALIRRKFYKIGK